MTNEPSDQELLAGMKRKEIRSLELIYDRYGAFAFSLAARILADKSLAEDVVQEVFRSIVLRVRRGDFHCDTDEQLWKILCIRAIKRLRGEIRLHHAAKRDVGHEQPITSSATDDGLQSGEPLDPHADPEKHTDDYDELEAVVGPLHPRCQVLVYLMREGYIQEELCELMGCSESTIKRLLHEARTDCQGRAGAGESRKQRGNDQEGDGSKAL